MTEATPTGDGIEPVERDQMASHLAALGSERALPEAALRACVARFTEVAQPLRALLDRAAAGKPLGETDSLRFFRGLFVMAAAGDSESCPSLLRLLRRSSDEVDELLGDAVTASLARLLIGLFDDDADALLAVAADRQADEYVRGAVLLAAAWLAWQGRIPRERLRRDLVALHETRAAEDGSFVWYAWMRAIALIDLRDLVPMVETAWKAKRIDHEMLLWSEYRTDLARARTAYADASRFDPRESGAIDDIVAELDWTRHWAEDEDPGSDALAPWDEAEGPAINPYRNVGRNDPCPCGSGKKAKKCCLASGA